MNEKEANLEWLSDPEVFRVNRLDAHSDHWFYEKKAEIVHEEQMPLKQSLNGSWLFSYAKNPGTREKDFYKNEFDCNHFHSIQVPGHIQLQGYDQCQYVNTMYPWDGHEELRPPAVSTEYNPVGSYVKYFELEEALKEKPVYISFQGVETACYVWLNGNFIGYSEDTFTPSEFELTKYLEIGANKLAVEVYKKSSASWIEDQDFWRFSGIFREVYLYATPKSHVKDLFIKADLLEEYKTGGFTIDMKLQGYEDCMVEVYLEDADHNRVLWLEAVPGKENVTMQGRIEHVLPWSAEHPYLYQLYIELKDKNGKLIEIVPQKVGFRKFEMIDKVMCINGKRIVFKGVNRHEFCAKGGRSISKEDMMWDIRFLKQNNLNAVRTSHYPNESRWYRLCDEYGIYVIDETNLESHGSWQKMGVCDPQWNVPGDLPQWRAAVLDRAESMLERDKNHPSILIWSCGNESYAGENILAISDYFHQTDDSRLVHYEGVFWNRTFDQISDMESRMYAKPEDIIKYLSENPQKPYISCEYMHAMGNSCGGMHLYTDLEEEYPMYQGGFLWDYIDQALATTNDQGKKVLAYGGDFDDRPTDYGFCTNGIVYADRTLSPKIQEIKYLYQNVKLISDEHGVMVKNQNLFLSTKGYDFVCWIERDGKKIHERTCSIEVAPETEQYLSLEYPVITEQGEYSYNISMRLSADESWAPRGHEISFGQSVVSVGKKQSSTDETMPLQVIYGDVNIGVCGKGFQVIFSKTEGGLVSLQYENQEYITRVPKTTFWRAPTDNDTGNDHGYRCGQWKTAGLYQKLKTVDVEEMEESVLLSYTFSLPTVPATENTICYRVTQKGTIDVQLTYRGVKGLPELPLFGVDFKLKEKWNQFQYYGYGPDENYIDRNQGARLGIFESTPIKSVSRYLVPQECGNRTGIRWIKVVNENHQGLCFSSTDTPFECSVLPYSSNELEHAVHREELPPIHYTWVRIMAKQMGVGGDDSWGAPVQNQYLIDSAEDLCITFTISKA